MFLSEKFFYSIFKSINAITIFLSYEKKKVFFNIFQKIIIFAFPIKEKSNLHIS